MRWRRLLWGVFVRGWVFRHAPAGGLVDPLEQQCSALHRVLLYSALLQ